MTTPGKLRVHRTLSISVLLIGLVLMILMITIEDEPGAIPLLLIVIGAGWYFVTRTRLRSLPGQTGGS